MFEPGADRLALTIPSPDLVLFGALVPADAGGAAGQKLAATKK
ncbi:hypothetical protein [Paraburkholderia sejongensis]|nr:hypothetical protein [Paraburkholderia sp. MMS20-SJTR3]